MKFLFACDLDNTLIHSYKHKTDDDICIEIYNGREQSFISRRTAELLSGVVKKILFVPVTTRSVEQYQRIHWTEKIKPEFAVVSNGANFLRAGVVDKNWRRDSSEFIQPYLNELREREKIFSRDLNLTVCRIVDESFLFLKCSDEVRTHELAEKIQKQTGLNVNYSGQKIYLFPPKLNKGAALMRLKKIFTPQKIFAAGDSATDLPMLDVADFAYLQKNFPDNGRYKKFSGIESVMEEIKSV